MPDLQRPRDREREVRLPGGNLTPVVRVGDTVRRAAGSWTPLVHDLLRHLRERGFLLGPEPLGTDEHGREILTYLVGDTVTKHPWPRWVWDDVLLVEAATALAHYHRAVADFRPPVVISRLGSAPLGTHEIVCHNDFAPYNSVFRGGRLTGIIDWDVVWPGRPSWDLAFVAWHWVPLHAPSAGLEWRGVAECERRLRVLVDTYGLDDRSAFVEQVVERIDTSRTGIVERARSGDEVFARLEREGHAAEMARAIEFVGSIDARLRAALE